MLALPAAACAAGPPVPAAIHPQPALVPAGRGAQTYRSQPTDAERSAAARDPLRAAILDDAARLARRMGLPAPEGDPRLDSAMGDLARNLRGDDLPARSAVDFLLSHYGLIGPQPELNIARATPGGEPELRRRFLEDLATVLKNGAVARIGLGIERTAEMTYVVIALQNSDVTITPVPRQLPARGSAVIAGRIAEAFREPQVVVTSPDGAVLALETARRDRSFRGALHCAAPGRYQIAITGVGAGGSEVLASFPVYCGVAPASAAGDVRLLPSTLDEGQAEAAMLALVNRDRAAAGLAAVTLDQRLSEVARAHSRDMADHNFVAHVSPRTGSPGDRVTRAGLNPELIRENVGRALSPDEAHLGFMISPGHRAAILDGQVRRIGIGIAFGKSEQGAVSLFVSELFTP